MHDFQLGSARLAKGASITLRATCPADAQAFQLVIWGNGSADDAAPANVTVDDILFDGKTTFSQSGPIPAKAFDNDNPFAWIGNVWKAGGVFEVKLTNRSVVDAGVTAAVRTCNADEMSTITTADEWRAAVRQRGL